MENYNPTGIIRERLKLIEKKARREDHLRRRIRQPSGISRGAGRRESDTPFEKRQARMRTKSPAIAVTGRIQDT